MTNAIPRTVSGNSPNGRPRTALEREAAGTRGIDFRAKVRRHSSETREVLADRCRGHLVLNPGSRQEVHEEANEAWTHEDN